MLPRAHKSQHRNGTSIGSFAFAKLAVVTDRQTDRPVRPSYVKTFAAIGRILLVLRICDAASNKTGKIKIGKHILCRD